MLTRDGPRSVPLREAGVPVTVIGKRFKLDPTALVRLRRLLVRRRPDIVHTWLFAANSFGRVAARLAGVPGVIASERCVDLWKTGLHLSIDRRLAKFTDAITTNSTGVRDFYAGQGIPAEKFHVIRNGIATCCGNSIERPEALRRLGVPDDPGRRILLAVGRLWPQKRYRDLIWAAELLGTIRDDVTLVIVGDGPQRGELLRHRDAVTTDRRVRFAGPREDVAELMPHADVFWIASEYEGQSNGVMEAMRAGVPVIASNIPGNRDLVVDGQTGLLLPLGDTAGFARATAGLLDEPERAEQMGRAGAARIRGEFTVEAMVEAHARLYRRVANANR